MKIGELSRRAEVPIDTVRYYERQGLLPVPERQASGYRKYHADDVTRLQFVRRAKALGFTLKEIQELLALSDHRDDDMADSEQRGDDRMASRLRQHAPPRVYQDDREVGG